MYICICHGVTENEINAEIATGARTEKEIGDRCGAGTGCGTCREKVCELLNSRLDTYEKIDAQRVVTRDHLVTGYLEAPTCAATPKSSSSSTSN